MNDIEGDSDPEHVMSAIEKKPFHFERTVSASLLRLRAKTPFFATLALFAGIERTGHFDTAATDGRDIWINPEFWQGLPPAQADGLLLHEVLHAALLHVTRRGTRERLLWNYAADIVVNGIIVNETPFDLPPGALRETSLESLGVEEVYELLQRDAFQVPAFCICDLLETVPGTGAESSGNGLNPDRRRLLESYWRQAREQAIFIASGTGDSLVPAGLERELGRLAPSLLPWKDYLWRFLVRTPTDFEEFDRRFLAQGLYLESLEGESVRVFVCVDTSSSVSDVQMGLLLAEVQGILRAYPHLECDLYYADAKVHGPFQLHPDAPIPKPIGGGGTDFRPFFEAVMDEEVRDSVGIYLTDGYGAFPSSPPDLSVLWVVTPGGLPLPKFPFGETVHLLQDSN